MSNKPIIITLLLICIGCTNTQFNPKTGLKRTSFLQKSEIAFIEVKPDGSVTMRGYKARGDVEMLGAAFEAGMNAAASKIVPAP